MVFLETHRLLEDTILVARIVQRYLLFVGDAGTWSATTVLVVVVEATRVTGTRSNQVVVAFSFADAASTEMAKG